MDVTKPIYFPNYCLVPHEKTPHEKHIRMTKPNNRSAVVDRSVITPSLKQAGKRLNRSLLSSYAELDSEVKSDVAVANSVGLKST